MRNWAQSRNGYSRTLQDLDLSKRTGWPQAGKRYADEIMSTIEMVTFDTLEISIPLCHRPSTLQPTVFNLNWRLLLPPVPRIMMLSSSPLQLVSKWCVRIQTNPIEFPTGNRGTDGLGNVAQQILGWREREWVRPPLSHSLSAPRRRGCEERKFASRSYV